MARRSRTNPVQFYLSDDEQYILNTKFKATVDKAIEYICNPDKTDEQIYVSSYACAPETAAIDFKYTLDHCRENSPNKAYHLIQAFAPGEVGYEEAHRISHLSDNLCKEHNLSVIIPGGERGKK